MKLLPELGREFGAILLAPNYPLYWPQRCSFSIVNMVPPVVMGAAIVTHCDVMGGIMGVFIVIGLFLSLGLGEGG